MDLSPCVRCGHAFERHRGWNVCVLCDCKGYSSIAPLDPKLGDELAIAGSFTGGISSKPVTGVVVAIEGDAIELELPDGTRRRFTREDVRVGRLRRPGYVKHRSGAC